jgi:N-acylglucosamine 2-epimerase
LRAWDFYAAYRSSMAYVRERRRRSDGQPRSSPGDHRYDAGFARDYVLDELLPFWIEHAVDRHRAGFTTCLGGSGEVFDSTKLAAMNARMVYALSVGHELDPSRGYLDIARSGVELLQERLWDPAHGGWHYSAHREGIPKDKNKEAFTQAYVLFGLTHYARVAEDGSVLKNVLEAYELLDERLWDGVHLGYYEDCDRDWTVRSDRKTACVQLDFLMGVHALHGVTGEARFRERAVELADLIVLRMRDPRTGGLLETFAPDWSYDPVRTRDVLVFGHSLKAVRLLLDVHRLGGDDRHRVAAEELLDFALEHGWDTRFGAFYQYAFRSGRLAAFEKWWWTQCEGLWALLLMHGATGRADYLALADELMDFCFTAFADPVFGDWHRTCTADGRPLDERKGALDKCPYHQVDACMAVIERFSPDSSLRAFADA